MYSSDTGEKWEYIGRVRQPIIDFRNFKKTYDSVKRSVWYNVLIEFDTPTKQARPTKMSLSL
jgi:hypothetical protein